MYSRNKIFSSLHREKTDDFKYFFLTCYLFYIIFYRESMLRESWRMKKSQKAILIMLGLWPLLLFTCMLYSPVFSDKLAAIFSSKLSVIFFYGSIILFPVTFLFYRLKVSKVKVWRGVLEAAGLLLLSFLSLLLWLLVCVLNFGIPMDGVH